MKHDFLNEIEIYVESPCCGWIGVIADPTTAQKCAGCDKQLDFWKEWFPEAAYEYAILLEDYHHRPPSDLRTRYFQSVERDNWREYWCSSTPPEFGPTVDWKPTTILLFRSLFELLLDHLLWRLLFIQLLPSSHAGRYPEFIAEQFRSVSSKQGKLYSFITGNTWKYDLDRFGFGDVYNLLQKSGEIRNTFIHEDPLAGHADADLAEQLHVVTPKLFALFARIANEYYHVRCKELTKFWNDFEAKKS